MLGSSTTGHLRRTTRAGLSAGLGALAALAWSATADAQVGSTTQITLTDTTQSSLSRIDCLDADQEISFSWSDAFTLGEREKVYLATTDSCADGTSDKVLVLRSEADRSTSGTGIYPSAGDSTEHLTPRKIFDLVADSCGGDAGIESTVYLCVKITGSSALGATTQYGKFAFTIDSKPPPTPSDVSVDPLEGGLVASWDMPDDLGGAARYRLYVTDSAGVTKTATVVGSGSTSAQIDGLQNDESYRVQVSSVDAAGSATDGSLGNESARSSAVTGTPRAVQDFWEAYKAAGGKGTGGCGAFDTGALGLGAAALWMLWGKRRRRQHNSGTSALFTIFALTLGAATAHAEDSLDSLRSPRRFAGMVQLGSYGPQVDSEPGLTGTPFTDVFGSDNTPLLARALLEVDLLDSPFGRLSVGGGTGFWQIIGKASLPDGTRTPDTVQMDIVPLTLHLSYRTDFLSSRFGIPLAPYGRLGYGWAHWDTSIHGRTSSVGSDSGSGWAQGLETAAGLQLVLDTLEPDKAALLDQDSGVNSTSLYAEWTSLDWTGAGGLRLSDHVISGGLLLAF